ncbi:MAG: PD40 domain-containing protein [Bacteroidales bacterium]|nr:PD40 domain-containing protein [Bacteroidales bacterium]
MKNFYYIILFLYCFMFSCGQKPENVKNVDSLPDIFPDYLGVTVPVNIAPLNFNVKNSQDVYVELSGNGEKLISEGEYADFDIEKWHLLTQKNIGGKITVSVTAKILDEWKKFKDFDIYVSKDSLNDYGLTFRLIPPGYETFAHIGIYQRNIHNFEQAPVVDGMAIQGDCMNCHVPNHANPKEFQLHVRGRHSATFIRRNGEEKYLQTATDSTIANCMYAYWHPSGKYIAYSLNLIHQTFFEDTTKYIEVYDNASDALIMDVDKNQLILYDKLMTEDFESYPVFSPDGKTLFYCSSKPYVKSGILDKMRYSLIKVSFDDKIGKIGSDFDTLINAEQIQKSITHPRPSYDGRFLMFCMADYSVFPIHHKESDLYLLNLEDNTMRNLTEVNSDFAETFHNFSSNSRWFVFNSRRIDKINNLLFISNIDENGHCTKPFLLPQKNPEEYYSNLFFSYNVPDFTSEKVELDIRDFARNIFNAPRIQVGVKRN